jgi:hypothetical protein
MVEANKTATPLQSGDQAIVDRAGAVENVDLTVVKANRQAGASYTVTLSDIAGRVVMTAAGGATITLPADATAAVPTDATVLLHRAQGAGAVIVRPETGKTLNGVVNGSVTLDEAAMVPAIKSGTDAWEIAGAGVAA